MTYEKMVLSHLEDVQRLPAGIQADIAERVRNFIQIARTAKDEALLQACASAAMEEQAKAMVQGATTMDPQWAAPALAEAWCYASLSLSKGYLNQAAAVAIIEGTEAFASSQAKC